MRNTFLVPELQELLANNDIQAIREFCSSMHPALIADSLGGLEPSEIWEILVHIPSQTQVEIFSNLDESVQMEMVEVLKREELASLISEMPSDDRVKEIMHSDVIFARGGDDQEDAARKIQKYGLLALPVINGNDALVGIITYDDAMDVITQEQTEDMEKLMAITGSHEVGAYLKMPAWSHFKNRFLWIIALAFLGLISGLIVQNFEGLLLQFAILATFMPMLADTGGNTGSQSATLVIRALALREITPKDIFRIFIKELQVSVLGVPLIYTLNIFFAIDVRNNFNSNS